MAERLFTVHDLFLVVAIVECGLLALSRVVLPSKNSVENCLLVFFMLVIGLNAFSTLLMWNVAIKFPWFFPLEFVVLLSLMTHFARGPLLYLYIKSLTEPNFKLTKQHTIHIIPVVCLLVSLLVWALLSDQSLGRDSSEWVLSIGKVVSLSYTLGFGWLIYQYRRRLMEGYSDLPNTETLWLYCLSVGFFINWSWAIVIGLSKEFGGATAPEILGPVQNYIYFIVINALFVYTISYTNRLLKLEPKTNDVVANEALKADIIDRVLEGVEKHDLHLEQGITIDEYASKINLPAKTVSFVLNRHQGTNFFEFINSHRIEHAKKLLVSPEYEKTSMLDILLMSGFNNKSSFHRFFKRKVGDLPSEYRRKEMRRVAN